MNIVEMHAAVMQGVDRIHAQSADTLLSAEIDLELNKAIQQFISTRYQNNNRYRTGFEESQKRRDDLRSLVVETTLPTVFKEVISNYESDFPVFVDTCTLPRNYMFQINMQAIMWRSTRCVALPYLLQNNTEEDFYFSVNWTEGISNNVDGLSTSYIQQLVIFDQNPDDNNFTQSTDLSGNTIDNERVLFWRWGQQFNDTPTAFTSLNPPTVFPANFSQVLGDILTYGRNGLIGNENTGGLNPNPGQYQDNIGPDWETVGNISIDSNIIIPWTMEMGDGEDQDGVSVPSIYSADLSNGWLSYIVGFDFLGNIVYKSPLQSSAVTLVVKRYPTAVNSESLSWTNSGITNETHPIKLVQFDDIYSMTTDPFNKTKYSSPLATMRENHIDLYTDESFIVDEVKLTYIRMPAIVQAPDNNCDLADHTHEEIVKMAVSSILEGISDPRYQTHQIEVGKME
tara:strand:+ start:5223 stop:6587 length:1365 start_codon:yes stop_codon:yes gene_type:complete